MSKHKMVDGRLLQMDKSFGQLKQKQKEKISEWMYQAYRKQTSGKLSDEEALQLVFDRIEEAKIWIPDYEILNRYRAKKNQFRKRLAGEKVPQHIFVMESILEKATQKMDALEKKIEEYEAFQAEIRKLEAYYTSPQWKADFAGTCWSGTGSCCGDSVSRRCRDYEMAEDVGIKVGTNLFAKKLLDCITEEMRRSFWNTGRQSH